MDDSTLTLCVLLWAVPGREVELAAYEDHVLALLGDHGARVLSRARGRGDDAQPLEIHLLEFPSQEALGNYMNDERRTARAGDRERAVARTEVIPVRLVD